MREPVNSTLVRRFMRDLAVRSGASGRVYLTGGASAVLLEWRATTLERSPFIQREGTLSFHHYDFYAQCLAKIERGHRKDEMDVKRMFDSGLVQRERLRALFEAIEPELYRYPAIDPASFRRAVMQQLQ